MKLIAAATLPVSRWHNGAGRKSDIAAGEGWLLGFAWLDADAPFSGLPGWDRTITLVEGPGFTLDIAGRAPLVARQPFVPGAFDGGAPTTCRVDGPCRVLNVMTARGRFGHGIAVQPPGPVDADYLVLLRGSATVAGTALAPLDAVRTEGAVTAGGSADALLAAIRIRPA